MPKNHLTIDAVVEREPRLYERSDGGKLAIVDLRAENPVTEKDVDFYDALSFDDVAESCVRDLKPGMRVTIEGQLAIRRWRRDGAWNKRPQIIIRSFQTLDVR